MENSLLGDISKFKPWSLKAVSLSIDFYPGGTMTFDRICADSACIMYIEIRLWLVYVKKFSSQEVLRDRADYCNITKKTTLLLHLQIGVRGSQKLE